MPAHIVLPNGMWRFVKGKSKSVSVKKSHRKRAKSSGGNYMARRGRRGSRRSGIGGLGVNKLLVAGAIGVGASMLAKQFAPQVPSDIAGAAAGFVFGGGVPGALAGFVAPKIIGGMNPQQSSFKSYGSY